MKFLEKYAASILNGITSPVARSVVPIDISQAADWFYRESETYEAGLRNQFPVAVSPFRVTFWEYKIPPTWKIKKNDKWTQHRTAHGPTDHFGMLMVQDTLPDGFSGKDPAENALISSVISELKCGSAPKFRQIVFFYAGNDKDCMPACWSCNYVDKSGRMMGGQVFSMSNIMRRRSPKLTDSEIYAEMVRAYAYPVYFAISLVAGGSAACRERGVTAKDRKKAAILHTIPFNYRDVNVQPFRDDIGGDVNRAMKISEDRWKNSGIASNSSGEPLWDSYLKVVPGTEEAVMELDHFKFQFQGAKNQ